MKGRPMPALEVGRVKLTVAPAATVVVPVPENKPVDHARTWFGPTVNAPSPVTVPLRNSDDFAPVLSVTVSVLVPASVRVFVCSRSPAIDTFVPVATVGLLVPAVTHA